MPDNDASNRSRVQAIENALDLFDAIENDKIHTQRGLASRLGVALGLTNALIKKCAKKGFLKIKEVPAKRYAYYLTPQGFQEKVRLTAEFLSLSLDSYRKSRNEYFDIIVYCKSKEWHKIAFCGSGDLTEIASLAAREAEVEVVAVVDSGKNVNSIQGIPVVQTIEEIDVDAVIITCSTAPQKIFDQLKGNYSEDRIFAPKILRIYRNSNILEDVA